MPSDAPTIPAASGRLRPGDEVTLTIESLGDRGKAVARLGRQVVFVRGAAPGDRVRAVIVRAKRSYAEAKLRDVLDPGPDRIEAPCPYFGSCGGCSLQHVAYEAQLRAKGASVRSALQQTAGLVGVAVRDPIGCADPYHYRNKMEFSFSASRWLLPEEIASGEKLNKSFALGLHAPGTFHKVVDLQDCLLPPKACAQVLRAVRTFVQQQGWEPWHIRRHVGYLRHLVLRTSTAMGDLMVNLVTSYHDPERMEALADCLRSEELPVTTLVNTINDTPAQTAVGAASHVIFGSGLIRDRIGPYIFEIGPGTFFQTNTAQAEVLCDVVRSVGEFGGDELLLDLYCGTGTFAIYLAADVGRAVGIELVPEAVEAAQRNAALNGIKNCAFVVGDMLKVFTPAWAESVGTADVVIVDPPRAGMHPKVVRRLAKLRPGRIVYVSCNPRTQARDVAVLTDHYEVTAVQPVDLFPQTYHVENVMVLKAKKNAAS